MVSISQNLSVLAECSNEVVDNMLDGWASIACTKKNIRFDTAVSRLFLELSETVGTPMSLPWCNRRRSVILTIQHIEVQLYSIVTKQNITTMWCQSLRHLNSYLK
jgi:hypothetical protein